jgi:lauroyl/myristoyl acyltransferase
MDREPFLKAFKYGLYCPLASLFPLPRAYRLARAWGRIEARRHPGLTAAIRANAESVLQSEGLPVSELGEKFFEVMNCDEIDAYAPLIHPWRQLRKWVRVTGEERILPLVADKKGVLLLSFHFGGGSLIFPYLRSHGVSAHYLSIPLQRIRALSGWVQYVFGRFRLWGIERTTGQKIIFVGGSKEKIRHVLRQGGVVVAVFDVVPEFLHIREWAEVCFFSRPARFPTGLLSVAAETGAYLVPFFGRVEEDLCRCLYFEEPHYVEREWDTLVSLVGLLEEYIRRYPQEWHHWPGLQDFYTQGKGHG